MRESTYGQTVIVDGIEYEVAWDGSQVSEPAPPRPEAPTVFPRGHEAQRQNRIDDAVLIALEHGPKSRLGLSQTLHCTAAMIDKALGRLRQKDAILTWGKMPKKKFGAAESIYALTESGRKIMPRKLLWDMAEVGA